MFEIVLNTGVKIELVSTIREVINMESGLPEVSILIGNSTNLEELYANISAETALDSITIIDLSGVADNLVITGYTHIASVERVFESIENLSGNLRVTIRLKK
jgi:hypothetical protein